MVEPHPRIVVLSPEELAAIVEKAVEKGVAHALRAHAATTATTCEWIGDEEVGEMLGIKPASVRKVRGLPLHKAGRARRYRRHEVEAFLTKSAIPNTKRGRRV